MSSPDDRPGRSTPVTGRPGWEQHPGVRTGSRLGPGERVADLLGRIAGSWAGLIVAALAGAALALLPGSRAGSLAGLGVLVLVEVALLQVAARRAERIAIELALFHLDQGRRAMAVAEDLRSELERLQADVARIAAYSGKAGHPPRRP